VIDVAAIARSGIRLAVDPLGGAGVEYWGAIGERYGLCLTVLNQRVDPTFRFVCVDWDGQIRMDPSSRYAMRGLTSLVDGYDLAGACDTDHDRHGIVVPGSGLMPANDYLAVMTAYLCRHRPDWPMKAAVGKTVVTTLMLNRVAARYGRGIFEVPVGFKWFTDGLLSGALAVAGEESAGASFARLDGSPWTTDKDGIVAVLLAAEMTAREGRNPVEQHAQLSRQLGHSVYRRVDAAATPAQKARMTRLDPERLRIRHLAGEAVTAIETRAPGNGEPLGGMRVTTANGWIALRASGTEDLYKLYAESFIGERHLQQLLEEGGRFVDEVLSGD
jgi:phosphoglucomutase